MRRAILGLLAIASVAAPAIARPSKTQLLVPASLVKPVDALHRTCGGACLKSGSLQWFCGPAQSCALSCSTAPPQLLCNGGR
ncbi:hypothetical protein ME121_2035 [Methylobacterium sp. ME121]|nr:hypothetical protein ME121_2035 [Methylobacterium sp. ME121]